MCGVIVCVCVLMAGVFVYVCVRVCLCTCVCVCVRACVWSFFCRNSNASNTGSQLKPNGYVDDSTTFKCV